MAAHQPEVLVDSDAYPRAMLPHGTERDEMAATMRDYGLSLEDLGWEFRSEGAIKSSARSSRSGRSRASTERTDTAATMDSYGLSLDEIQTALVAGRSRPLLTP